MKTTPDTAPKKKRSRKPAEPPETIAPNAALSALAVAMREFSEMDAAIRKSDAERTQRIAQVAEPFDKAIEAHRRRKDCAEQNVRDLLAKHPELVPATSETLAKLELPDGSEIRRKVSPPSVQIDNEKATKEKLMNRPKTGWEFLSKREVVSISKTNILDAWKAKKMGKALLADLGIRIVNRVGTTLIPAGDKVRKGQS